MYRAHREDGDEKIKRKADKMIERSRTEIEHLIDEWIFSERDRKILKRRLLDGICYEPLAEEFDISVRQIKTIVYRQQERLFKHL